MSTRNFVPKAQVFVVRVVVKASVIIKFRRACNCLVAHSGKHSLASYPGVVSLSVISMPTSDQSNKNNDRIPQYWYKLY